MSGCLITLLGTVSVTRCLVTAYCIYLFLLMSLFAFENILLSATVSSIFGLHAGGQILGFLKATGATAGLVIFGFDELFIFFEVNLDYLYYGTALLSALALPVVYYLDVNPIVEEDSSTGLV